jgi:hypothetical protein
MKRMSMKQNPLNPLTICRFFRGVNIDLVSVALLA